MKLSVTAPVPAGAAMIRDHRAWHGGTPNLGRHARAIPATFWSAPWYRKPTSGSGAYGRSAVIPRSIYETLSADGQRVAGHMASESETVDDRWAPDWDREASSTAHLEEAIPKL